MIIYRRLEDTMRGMEAKSMWSNCPKSKGLLLVGKKDCSLSSSDYIYLKEFKEVELAGNFNATPSSSYRPIL